MITQITVCFFLLSGSIALAQDNSDCLKCHDTADLQAVRDGRTVSLLVDEDKYELSVHGSMDCIDCHESLEGVEEYPHAVQLDRVSCDTCHEDESD